MNHGNPGLDDPRLLSGDQVERIAELLLVVIADAGDDAQGRLTDVGAVESSSQADFDHVGLGTGLLEQQPGQRGGHFEKGGGPVLRLSTSIGRFSQGWQGLEELCRGDRYSPDYEAFLEVFQVGRGVEAGSPP